ncbi:hypothetical protein HMPREF0653_00331 [Prevotella disiens JCM 6334 = ATCC 29426]|uniref:Uncharacterized protein n=1 Tax=Prevotella disiens JCM 6334 = ATCC 29426 TaxID=1235811 RepID=A0ABN0NV46_9BACT|nr:hypothetical protein HMPREF0653_00331 [Prevotella disiens JCM 6334 = ATCC 29426]
MVLSVEKQKIKTFLFDGIRRNNFHFRGNILRIATYLCNVT